ncbi:O-antigen polymerase [Shewanella sp. MBTL60-007]|uniref:O-antigen polymerase n=1 Tax=Shewanella sp. MBTL60-007 TaxID=2815911 RepID=UPI001C7F8C26|nr:O-antigen polymerase [Shewanella sp. MBTL60-007]
MLVLLVFTLFIMLVMAMYLTKYDVLSPSIVLIIGFLITSVSSLYVNIISDMSISMVTYLVIVTSIMFFLCGEGLAKVFVNSISKSVTRCGNINTKETNIDYHVPQSFLYLIVVVALYTCLGQYEYILESGRLFSKDGGTLELIAASRICTIEPIACESVPFSMALKLGLLTTKCISYFIVFLLIFKRGDQHLKRKASRFAFYLILTLFCIQLLLSTARTGFIYFLIYVFAMWAFFQYKSERVRKKAVKVILKKAVKVFLFSCLIFYALGYFTSKSNDLSIADMLIGYTGYQNFALDLYLDDECNKFCSPIGPETFYGLRATLFRFGFVENWMRANLSFAEFENGRSSNVYTAIRRVISDFSLFGSYIYFFILGVFYGVLYKSIQINRKNDFSIALYCMLLFPVFMNAWEERFSNVVFSTFMFANVIILYFVFYIFKRRY